MDWHKENEIGDGRCKKRRNYNSKRFQTTHPTSPTSYHSDDRHYGKMCVYDVWENIPLTFSDGRQKMSGRIFVSEHVSIFCDSRNLKFFCYTRIQYGMLILC